LLLGVEVLSDEFHANAKQIGNVTLSGHDGSDTFDLPGKSDNTTDIADSLVDIDGHMGNNSVSIHFVCICISCIHDNSYWHCVRPLKK